MLKLCRAGGMEQTCSPTVPSVASLRVLFASLLPGPRALRSVYPFQLVPRFHVSSTLLWRREASQRRGATAFSSCHRRAHSPRASRCSCRATTSGTLAVSCAVDSQATRNQQTHVPLTCLSSARTHLRRSDVAAVPPSLHSLMQETRQATTNTFIALS